MSDFGPGQYGWVRGGWSGWVVAPVALALFAAVAAADESPAPWEIQGYSQVPVWGGAERVPDASRLTDGPPPWTDSGPWQPSPGQWSGQDGAPEFPRVDEPAPQGHRHAPGDGYGGFSGPFPAEAHSPGRSDPPGDAQYPGYGLRTDRVPLDPWRGPRQVPDNGAGGFSTGAYPGYRFRGDPEPVGSPWSSQPDRGGYRFRPMTEGERDRQDRGSVWRPAEPATVPRQDVLGEPGADRDYAPGPAYGFEPNPWQVR